MTLILSCIKKQEHILILRFQVEFVCVEFKVKTSVRHHEYRNLVVATNIKEKGKNNN